MKKNIALRRLVLTALAVMMITLLIPASVFAATKSKRVKNVKRYNPDGKLISETSYQYDSKGNIKKEVYKFRTDLGKNTWTKRTTTYKRTYHSNGMPKKISSKCTDGTKYVSTYDSNGYLKKSVNSYKESGKTITSTTTYKRRSNGMPKSSTFKRGKTLSSKSTYDSNGRLKKRQQYDVNGKKVISTHTFTYKISKGRVIKETEKKSDGSQNITEYKYDKKGNLTMWKSTHIFKDEEGKTQTYSYKYSYKYKYNKDGTIKQESYYNETGKLEHRDVYTYTSKKY